MNVLDALCGEHAVLRLMVDDLSRRIHEYDVQTLRATVRQFEAALISHAEIEDDLLFGRLSPSHAGIARSLTAMNGEHKLISDKLSHLFDAEAAGIVPRYRKLAELVLEHFAVEERVLFPMAATMVSSVALDELGREWARRRCVDLPDDINRGPGHS